MQLLPRLNELFEHSVRLFLVEMNVANLDEIQRQFALMFDNAVQHRGVQIPAPLRMFLIKRAVKAMQNDEQGHMVIRDQVEELPENPPAWLVKALENGETVYSLSFKEGFENRLAHVVDWIAADQTADRTIRATPEADFLGHLAQAADRYFAEQQQKAPVGTDEGEEVVMTFRTNPATEQVVAYKENSIAPDKARGDVVAFWVNLTTPEALNREGKLMQHCVGSYADVVASQHVVIYSLRDERNQPHVTLELNKRYGQSINQVKGKQNRPPIGKYAPYVRDFLNDIGINPSESGRNDLRGMGLLAYMGKFGTISEIVGKILVTFPNGDSMRNLQEENEKSSWSYRHQANNDSVWYVERAGTVPLKLTLSSGNKLVGHDVLRPEPSRYPVYAKNLIQWFTDSGVTSSASDELASLDVFYDELKNKWGNRADLTEKMMEHRGVIVSRLGDTVYFSHGDTLFVSADLSFTANRRTNTKILGLNNLKVINDIPALREMPAVMTAFADQFLDVGDYSMMSDRDKNTILGFGLTRRTKQGYRSVPEDKTIYRSQNGSIRQEMARLYFYSKHGVLLGSTYIGASTTIAGNKLFILGSDNKQQVLKLISDLTTKADLNFKADNFEWGEAYRDAAELGFFQKAEKLVPLSQVVFSVDIPGGFRVGSQISEQHHNQSVALYKGRNKILYTSVKDNDEIEDFWMAGDNNYRAAGSKSLADYREQIAYLINVAKLKVKRAKMLGLFLQERNGKVLPQTDPQVIELYKTDKLPLGDNYVFHLHGYRTRFGSIDFETKHEHVAVIYVDWTDEEKHHELTYRYMGDAYLRRHHADLKITRAQIIRAATKFQHFFHRKIEPYLSDELVGGGTRKA